MQIVLPDEGRSARFPAGMPRLQVRPFDAGHLDDAARLLVARHAAQRRGEPSLPAAYEDIEVARSAIEELLTPEASGSVGTRRGSVVGYLVGTPRADQTW